MGILNKWVTRILLSTIFEVDRDEPLDVRNILGFSRRNVRAAEGWALSLSSSFMRPT